MYFFISIDAKNASNIIICSDFILTHFLFFLEFPPFLLQRPHMLQFKTPNMNFQKELIGNFNGIEYYLEYRHISEALRELLMNRNLVETMQFSFNYKSRGTIGREYSEMFNCK